MSHWRQGTRVGNRTEEGGGCERRMLGTSVGLKKANSLLERVHGWVYGWGVV